MYCPDVQLHVHVVNTAVNMLFPQADPGVVSCQEGQLHGLETGDQVEFKEVVGMEILNGKTFTVKGTLFMFTSILSVHHCTHTHTQYYLLVSLVYYVILVDLNTYPINMEVLLDKSKFTRLCTL